jgi:putative phosphoribosyl transferase
MKQKQSNSMEAVALPFSNRREAGRLLAQRLVSYQGRADVIVLGLPRGGAPVAFEVADSLAVALDVLSVRKLRVPGCEEMVMGAIGAGGVRVLNYDVVLEMGVGNNEINQAVAIEQEELERRERAYGGDRPAPVIAGQTVILVDDGLATGATMRAAVAAVRHLGAGSVVVAVPVAPVKTCQALGQEAQVVCLASPEPFQAIGSWYERFPQVSDAEVCDLLEDARSAASGSPAGGTRADPLIDKSRRVREESADLVEASRRIRAPQLRPRVSRSAVA